MATQYITLDPTAGVPDETAPPGITQDTGTVFPTLGVAFDSAATESIYYVVQAINFASGGALQIDWYAVTSTTVTDGVRWEAQIAAYTPNTDSNAIGDRAFDTTNGVTDTILGTTAARIHRTSITLTNFDGVAQDDWFVLKLYRDHDHADDDLAEDAIVVGLTLSYTSV